MTSIKWLVQCHAMYSERMCTLDKTLLTMCQKTLSCLTSHLVDYALLYEITLEIIITVLNIHNDARSLVNLLITVQNSFIKVWRSASERTLHLHSKLLKTDNWRFWTLQLGLRFNSKLRFRATYYLTKKSSLIQSLLFIYLF